MNTEKLMEAIGAINDRYISDYAVIEPIHSSTIKHQKHRFSLCLRKAVSNHPKRRAVVALLCFIVMIGVISVGFLQERPIQSLFPNNQTDTADGEDLSMPVLLYVNDKLYRFDRLIDKEDIAWDNLFYLGTVTNSVSQKENPTDNFQSNCDNVGAAVYKYAEDIVVINCGEYELYTPFE